MTNIVLYVFVGSVGLAMGWLLSQRSGERVRRQAVTKLELLFESDKAKVIAQLEHARQEHEEQRLDAEVKAVASQQRAIEQATEAVEKRARDHAQVILEQRQQADQLLRDNSKRHAEQLAQLGNRYDRDKQSLVDVVSALQAKMQSMMTALQLPPMMVPGLHKAMTNARPRASEFNTIAARVRGIALVNGVVVADRSGLALTEAPVAEQDDIASVVPQLHSCQTAIMDALGFINGLTVMTTSMRIVDFRRLPLWTNGAYLASYAFSQPPNAAAIDAAVAYATFMRPFQELELRSVDCTATGYIGKKSERTEALCKELAAQQHLTECRVLALTTGATVAAGVLQQGVGAAQCDVIARCLHQLRVAVRGSLREKDLIRIELSLSNGIRIGMAPLSPGSKLAIMYLTVGDTLNELQVERTIGHLRRFLSVHQASLDAAA